MSDDPFSGISKHISNAFDSLDKGPFYDCKYLKRNKDGDYPYAKCTIDNEDINEDRAANGWPFSPCNNGNKADAAYVGCRKVLKKTANEHDRNMAKYYADQAKKEKQANEWKEAGLCKSCGGNLRRCFKFKYFIGELIEPSSGTSFPFECASCGKTYTDLKICVIFSISKAIIAVLGACILQICTSFPFIPFLVPFTILFFVENLTFGFRLFIRTISIIAQIIISVSIVNWAANTHVPVFLPVLGSMMLFVACITAFRRPLWGYYWDILKVYKSY